MSFMNALGSVSRRGQWRLRRVFRASLADGRLDQSDTGLINFSSASDVVLTVTPRPPYRRSACGWDLGCAPGCDGMVAPVLTASMAAGTLFVSNPGIVEALFPDGWSAGIPPGLYDVRVAVTIGPETSEILNEPVELR